MALHSLYHGALAWSHQKFPLHGVYHAPQKIACIALLRNPLIQPSLEKIQGVAGGSLLRHKAIQFP